MIKRLGLLGVGLMGGSLALALRQAGLVQQISGYDIDVGQLNQALDLGVIDYAAHDLNEAVADADAVILALPVGAIKEVCRLMASVLPANAFIMDVGSVKGSVIEAVKEGLGQLPPRFVPAHPLAGREVSGVQFADSHLFENHRVVLTPLPETDSEAVILAETLWRSTGAMVEQMDPDRHDRWLAATSHLPHLLSFCLVDMLGDLGDPQEIFRLSGGGLRDCARIAGSDPVMWRDIVLENDHYVQEAIDQFMMVLKKIEAMVSRSDSQGLFEAFAHARALRERYLSSVSSGEKID